MAQLTVYRGDDTDGTFGRHLSITVEAPQGTSFTGCKAEFTVNGVTKRWTTVVSGTPLDLAYTHEETAGMPLGAAYGTFRIIDASGNVRTLDDAVPFALTNDLNEVYSGGLNASVTASMVVHWTDVLGRPNFVGMDPDGATVADVVLTMQEAEK